MARRYVALDIVVSAVLIVACRPPVRIFAPSHELACPDNPAASLRIGAFLGDGARDGTSMRRAIESYATRVGRAPAIVKLHASLDESLGQQTPVGAAIDAIEGAGAIAILSLGTERSPEPLRRMARGDVDSLLRVRARELMSRNTLIIELAPEMNGRRGLPWQTDGTSLARDTMTATEYRAAWRRVVEVFRAAGATHTRWLWSPAAGNPYTARATGESHWNWMERYYPGDDVVDAVGLHALNDAEGQRAWMPFVELVDGDGSDHAVSTLLSRHPDKPIVLAALGSSELPRIRTAKGAWITTAFESIRRCRSIAGVVWLDAREHRDWRIDSSLESLRAYRAATP